MGSDSPMFEVLQLKHFSSKGKRPKRLILLEEPPKINSKGYAEEGNYLLVIEDEGGRVAFQLSEAEASLLVVRLKYVLNNHSRKYMDTVDEAKVFRNAEGGEGGGE